MTLYGKFLCFILIYLISDSKWVLVQSSESSPANPNPGTGTQEGTSVTTPAAGGNNSSTKTGVELSLKATAATNEFDYNKDGNVVTYTAKDNYAFKSVKTKTGGSSCGSCGSGGSEVTIWDAKDATEYASKVVLSGKGKKEKMVIIYLLNGTKKSYKKDKNNPWNESDSKTIPVSVSTGIHKDTPSYTCKIENDVVTFTPNEGFAFNEVICDYATGGETVWKTDKESEYANKVVLEEGKRARIHLMDGSAKVYKLSDSKWKEDTQASTQKSTTDGSGGTDQSGGGTTGTDGSGGGTTPASPTSGGTTGTCGSGGTDQSGGGTTGTDGSGGTDQSGGGTTGTGGGGTQQSTPATQ